jgi:hypothetical protein
MNTLILPVTKLNEKWRMYLLNHLVQYSDEGVSNHLLIMYLILNKAMIYTHNSLWYFLQLELSAAKNINTSKSPKMASSVTLIGEKNVVSKLLKLLLKI